MLVRKKISYLFVSILLSAFCLVSCGDDDDDDDDDDKSLTFEFDGNYVTDCVKEEEGVFSIRYLIIKGNTLTNTVISYDNSSCNETGKNGTTVIEMVVTGIERYFKDATVIKKPDVKSAKITFYKDEEVASANVSHFYGFTDWAAGVTKDITEAHKLEFQGNTELPMMRLYGYGTLYVGTYYPNLGDLNKKLDETSADYVYTIGY